MKKHTIIIAIISFLLLTSCMANSHEYSETYNTKGFWYGLWHGLISPIALIVSIFNGDISIYDANNNGFWYNLGFMLGISNILTGGSKVSNK